MQEFYKPISASEAEEIKKKRIAFLSSRTTGIIPIIDFVTNRKFYGRVKFALLYGLNEGWYYYLDDLTKEVYLSAPMVGKKNWYFLIDSIREALLNGEYPEHCKALEEHFSKQYGEYLFYTG